MNTAIPQPNLPVQVTEADAHAVRALEARYDAAWDSGDIDSILSVFTEDAVLVDPKGRVTSGRGAIGLALGEFLKGEAAGSTHRSTLSRMAFVTADVAVVDGHAVLQRDAARAPALVHEYTEVLVRRGGTWLIAHVRAYSLRTVPSNDVTPLVAAPRAEVPR